MSEWHPIETAPRDGRDILVTNAEIVNWWNVVSWQGAPTFSSAGWEDVESNIQYMEGAFTHWMPLPDPPKM